MFFITEIDPFTNKLSWSIKDVIQLSILSITLAPLRLICIFILLLVIWIICKIALIGISFEETTTTPFTGWRQNLNVLVHKLLRVVAFCMGIHQITVTGEQVSFLKIMKQGGKIKIVFLGFKKIRANISGCSSFNHRGWFSCHTILFFSSGQTGNNGFWTP